jgi:hypothetical protein
LERVRHPKTFATNVRDSLVCEPIVVFGKGFIDAIVEVFVVGEDDMTANVIKLEFKSVRDHNEHHVHVQSLL